MQNSEILNLYSKTASKTQAGSTKTEEARAIANCGNFTTIKSTLISQNLLDSEIIRVSNEFNEALSKIKFLTRNDLEMITIIELYDKDLAIHSLETYRIAKEKIEKILAFDVKLVELFTKEGVLPDQFLRACLLHDIGKIQIPKFILNNQINYQEMDVHLNHLVLTEKNQTIIDKIKIRTGEKINIVNNDQLKQLLKKHHLRPIHFVPTKLILTEQELEVLVKQNIDLDSTLLDIIKTHEGYSKDILAKQNLPIESDLVGSHHNYHGKGSPYHMTIDSLQIRFDMAELIRIADMIQALTYPRAYKKSNFSVPKALKIILEEAKVGRINTKIAYLWIEDEIREIENNIATISNEDLKNITFLKNELMIIENTIPTKLSNKPLSVQMV